MNVLATQKRTKQYSIVLTNDLGFEPHLDVDAICGAKISPPPTPFTLLSSRRTVCEKKTENCSMVGCLMLRFFALLFVAASQICTGKILRFAQSPVSVSPKFVLPQNSHKRNKLLCKNGKSPQFFPSPFPLIRKRPDHSEIAPEILLFVCRRWRRTSSTPFKFF